MTDWRTRGSTAVPGQGRLPVGAEPASDTGSRDPTSWALTMMVVLALASAATAVGCGRPARPNVLLYVVDTLRADGIASYGNPVVDTPNVDRLAADGTFFEKAYAPSSWTRASIASLLTSTYPAVHGAVGRSDPLAESLLVLPELLSREGWSTASIVTNPNVGSAFGFARGYDQFFELYERRQRGRITVAELETTSDRVTDVAIDWLDRAPEPFFLTVLAIDPHSPYQPPARFDRYGGDYAGSARGTGEFINRQDLTPADKQRIRSLYWGEIAFTDHSFGALLAHLAAKGVLDRTLVVFTSDHGEEFWEHGARGHGKSLFEEVLHVPLILRLPGAIQKGRRAATPVELVDVTPTVLSLCGVPIPEQVQGQSLLHDSASTRPIYAHLDLDGLRLESLRVGSSKLIESDGADPMLFQLGPDGRERAIASPVGGAGDALTRKLAELRADFEQRRREAFHGSSQRQVGSQQLSPEARQELEALGYLQELRENGD